jgi:hypothetical protein
MALKNLVFPFFPTPLLPALSKNLGRIREK